MKSRDHEKAGLPKETVARDGNCLIQRFAHVPHFGSFRILCGCILIDGTITKCTQENRVYGSNVEIISIDVIYKASVCV
jgi:hypothetical protein